MGNAAIAGLLNYPPNVRAGGPSVATGRGHATTFQVNSICFFDKEKEKKRKKSTKKKLYQII